MTNRHCGNVVLVFFPNSNLRALKRILLEHPGTGFTEFIVAMI